MQFEDYTGNLIEYEDCPACAYANHKFSLPCGMAYEDEICTVSQDWQLPINGMMIISPKRHVTFFEELTKEERIHIFEITNNVISILRENNISKDFNVLFEEKKGRHFHIWILPRDSWKELGIDPTKNIGDLQKYSLNNFRTKEKFEQIARTSQIISDNKEKIIDNQPVADKEELLRVLNDDGSLTDHFEKRSIIHKQRLPHQEVAFIPINSKGEILLQRRSKNKKSYPNCWALCAGHVVENQTPLEAVIMEANEELGLNLTISDVSILVDKTKNEREDNFCFATCFYKKIDLSIDKFKKQDEEVEELKWTTLDDFEKMVKEEKNCIFKNNEYYNKIIERLKQITLGQN